MGLVLDMVAARYGKRPSEIMMMDGDTAGAVVFDITIAAAGAEEEERLMGKSERPMTTTEKIRRDRERWKYR